MARLFFWLLVSAHFLDARIQTSETPNSFKVTCPPWSVPSSISICWKQRLSRFSSKSSRLGLSHCWSLSVFDRLRSEMSWVIFSKTSVSKWLFGWLEPIFDLNPPEAAGEDVKRPLDGVPSSLRFFADGGDLTPLWAVFVVSVRTRFCGGGRASPGILNAMPVDVGYGTEKLGEDIEGSSCRAFALLT